MYDEDDDYLFDYLLIENWDLRDENEALNDENDELRDENKALKKQLQEKEDSLNNRHEVDYDEVRFFAEDVQSIASDSWVEMEISYEEAENAILLWYTPEEYYEFKIY